MNSEGFLRRGITWPEEQLSNCPYYNDLGSGSWK